MPSSLTQKPVSPVMGVPIVAEAVIGRESTPDKSPSTVAAASTVAETEAIKAELGRRAWPRGLAEEFISSLTEFPARYVIVDNSGSMQTMDGSRLVHTSAGFKTVSSTRWAELGDTVIECAELASALGAETSFHMLNPTTHGQFFTIHGRGHSYPPCGRAGSAADLETIRRVMGTSPGSTTPLTEAVTEIISLIAPHAHALRQAGQKAVVVIATDGLPNDSRSFQSRLIELQRLPVWLVVRLCTNDDNVVEYWSELDKQLEAPMEVIDDLAGEAGEIHRVNPWLTYGPPLQLARTLGLHDRLFDLLDEQPMHVAQLKPFLERLLAPKTPLPEPELEPHRFLSAVREALELAPLVYNPRKRLEAPWVDLNSLEKHVLGSSSPSCVVS